MPNCRMAGLQIAIPTNSSLSAKAQTEEWYPMSALQTKHWRAKCVCGGAVGWGTDLSAKGDGCRGGSRREWLRRTSPVGMPSRQSLSVIVYVWAVLAPRTLLVGLLRVTWMASPD